MGGVYVPQMRQKDDALSTVMKGLQIAQSIYGIKTDMAKLEEHDAAQKAAKADKDFAAKGGIEQTASRDMIGKGWKEVDPSEEGALIGFVRTATGEEKKIGLRAPQKEKDLVAITTPGPGGKPEQKFVPKEEGKSYQVYEKPEKAKPDEFRQTDIAKAAQDEGNKLEIDIRGYRDVIDSAGDAKALLAKATTNPAAAAPALRRVARLFEKGVLTDSDVKDYGGSQAVFDSLERLSKKAADGTLTKEDATQASELVEVALSRAQMNSEAMTQAAVDRFSYNYKVPPTEAYRRLTGREFKKGEAKTEVASDGKTSAPPNTPAPPKVGEEQDGYVFKGGDPKDPSNWVQKGGQTPWIGNAASILGR